MDWITVFTTLTSTSSVPTGRDDLGSVISETFCFLGSNPIKVAMVEVDKSSDGGVVVVVVVVVVWTFGHVCEVVQQQKGPVSFEFKGPSPVGC